MQVGVGISLTSLAVLRRLLSDAIANGSVTIGGQPVTINGNYLTVGV